MLRVRFSIHVLSVLQWTRQVVNDWARQSERAGVRYQDKPRRTCVPLSREEVACGLPQCLLREGLAPTNPAAFPRPKKRFTGKYSHEARSSSVEVKLFGLEVLTRGAVSAESYEIENSRVRHCMRSAVSLARTCFSSRARLGTPPFPSAPRLSVGCFSGLPAFASRELNSSMTSSCPLAFCCCWLSTVATAQIEVG